MDEHRQVVEAVIRGDERGASDCLRTHVAVQGRRFVDLVASLRE